VLPSVVSICISAKAVVVTSVGGTQLAHTSVSRSSFGPAVKGGETGTPGHILVERPLVKMTPGEEEGEDDKSHAQSHR
jgi:hypothetical protein